MKKKYLPIWLAMMLGGAFLWQNVASAQQTTLERLQDMLRSPNQDVRRNAADEIREGMPHNFTAATALPLISQTLMDPDIEVQKAGVYGFLSVTLARAMLRSKGDTTIDAELAKYPEIRGRLLELLSRADIRNGKMMEGYGSALTWGFGPNSSIEILIAQSAARLASTDPLASVGLLRIIPEHGIESSSTEQILYSMTRSTEKMVAMQALTTLLGAAPKPHPDLLPIAMRFARDPGNFADPWIIKYLHRIDVPPSSYVDDLISMRDVVVAELARAPAARRVNIVNDKDCKAALDTAILRAQSTETR